MIINALHAVGTNHTSLQHHPMLKSTASHLAAVTHNWTNISQHYLNTNSTLTAVCNATAGSVAADEALGTNITMRVYTFLLYFIATMIVALAFALRFVRPEEEKKKMNVPCAMLLLVMQSMVTLLALSNLIFLQYLYYATQHGYHCRHHGVEKFWSWVGFWEIVTPPVLLSIYALMMGWHDFLAAVLKEVVKTVREKRDLYRADKRLRTSGAATTQTDGASDQQPLIPRPMTARVRNPLATAPSETSLPLPLYSMRGPSPPRYSAAV